MKKPVTTVFLAILILCLFSACQPKEVSNTEIVNQLYAFKDTYIGDASKTRNLIELANTTDYSVESIKLKTDAQPFRLTVNFAVENRADYRYIDENGLNRMSGILLALIPNLDEISYLFYDDYSEKENPDTAFSGVYYTKDNLCENMSNITPGDIVKSVETIRTFEAYYQILMATEVAVPDRKFTDKVYELIGTDCEIVVNSGIGAEIELDAYRSDEFTIISEQLPLSIGKYQGAGITANLTLYDIRNFKTGEISQCVFFYYVHPDEGVIVIQSDFVDRERYQKILKFIMEVQGK